jgi:tetratricopeptide (TPR) repeat protein
MDPQLSAGAYHGLGQAYFQLGDQKKAVRYLIRGLQAVDTNLAVSQDEVAELTAVYDRVQGALDGRSDEALTPVNERFISLLGGADWKQRIAETRRHLEEIIQDQGEGALVDFLETEGADELAELVAAIDRYIRQNLLTLAMDEAHYAVEKMPTYLPIHVRMAEIMMREGRIRQAINKYNMVAKSYMVRGEKDRSASILGEVLEMAPLDVNVRSSLISLLEEEERWDDVLEQYVGLADTYHQLGNFDLTRSTYARAEQLANKTDAPVEKRVEIKHHIADLDQMRLNTRGAQKMYEEILVMVPEDEKAHRMLIDLYYNQGNQVEAVKRLDRLLGLYAKQKQINRITLVLEELVKHYPNDAGLRSRLSQIYKRLGRKRDAIEQLDALGELQIEAGLHEDAVDTIRRIITLEPEHVEDYERLLEQLGGA